MTIMHQVSPCCGAVAHRHGDRRYRCALCGHTWRRYPHKRGRDPGRGTNALIRRVIGAGERLSHQQAHYPALSASALATRFAEQLTRFLERPPWYPGGTERYVLVVDALWYTFNGKQWTLYCMALKPPRHTTAYLLEPVLRIGKESARGWHTAIASIPDQVLCRIDGFVSDNLAGLTTVADKHGWVHQLCHFHLLREVLRRLGRRRPHHTAHRDIREEIHRHLRTVLRGTDTAAGIATESLIVLAANSRCPQKLRMVARTAVRRVHRYRAYRTHPALTLPTTTGCMESLAAQLRLRTARLRTPHALARWARAYVRLQQTIRCSGEIPPN